MKPQRETWRPFPAFLLFFHLATATLLATAPSQILSDTSLAKIVFEQKLDQQVSLDLNFRDENGNPVKLRDYFNGKPVILVLGYYECPMLCTIVLNGLVEALQDMKWSI